MVSESVARGQIRMQELKMGVFFLVYRLQKKPLVGFFI